MLQITSVTVNGAKGGCVTDERAPRIAFSLSSDRQGEVYVRIDNSGKNKFPRRVDHLPPFERVTKCGDLLPEDPDIGREHSVGGHHGASSYHKIVHAFDPPVICFP